MGENALREQFQMLQEQKKKRLMKKNEVAAKLEKFDYSDGIDENLNLQLYNQSQDIKETDDYKDLQETVQELRDENGRLEKLLGEKEEELKIVRRRWKAEREELGGIGSEHTASKIIELSKKVRELTTAIEKEKSKSLSLVRKLDIMDKKQAPAYKPTTTELEKQALEVEFSNTKEKLNHALLKSAESRSEVENLKKELKIAQKVLTREVGDNVNIHSLLKESSGWRGRQQQILGLQLKVTELQQLCGNKVSSGRNALLGGITQHDEKHRLVTRKIEAERKEKQDKLQEDLVLLRSEKDSYKEKNSAARTRNKILSQEIKNLKEQLATMNSKGKHDDELINVLLREQEYLKEENMKLKEDLAEKSALGERVLKASGNFSTEKNENDKLVCTLKEEINIQEEKVKQLEKEVEQLKHSKNSRERRSFIPRPLSSGDRLMTSSSYGNLNQDSDFDSSLQESRTLCDAANVEKEKLGELVQVLQRRNEDIVKQLLEKDFALSELRDSNANLRKKVEKLSLNQSNSHDRNSYVARNLSGNKVKNLNNVQEQLFQTESKLSIQMDNNDALKSALESTLKAKEEDLKAFHNITEQTKKIFLQGLRQYRQTHMDT